MKREWLVVIAILLFLFSWTSVFAGPKGSVEQGDDDIPELVRPRHPSAPQRPRSN